MNIEELGSRLENQDFIYDFRNEKVHVGDTVICIDSFGDLCLKPVIKICPTGIKVADSNRVYYSSKICKADKLINSDELHSFREKATSEIEKAKLVERWINFCYKKDNEVGIGAFKFECEPKQKLFKEKINEFIANNKNVEYYFVCRRNNEFYINETVNDLKNILIMSTNNNCPYNFYNTNVAYNQYITEKNKAQYKDMITEDYNRNLDSRKRYNWRIKKGSSYEYDENFLFLYQKYKNEYLYDKKIYSCFDSEKSSYVDLVKYLSYYDKEFSYYSGPEKFYDSYVDIFKNFLINLSR